MSVSRVELMDKFDPSAVAEESLLPKAAWRDAVHAAVEEAHRSDSRLAVIFMDVDHFKHINDVYGHEFGDEVIERIRQSIQKNLRVTESRPSEDRDIIGWNGDTAKAGHIGGDEFAVLCNTDDKGTRALVERLRSGFDQDIAQDEKLQGMDIKLSFGVAVLQPGMTASQLMRMADSEMYEDKMSNLPELNEQQQKFIEGIAQGLEDNNLKLRDIGKHLVKLARDSGAS